MKKIVLTGGGTAGHVVPNIALLSYLEKEDYTVEYIGSINGMEKDLIEKLKIPYYSIHSGKLRRYLDLKNVTDCVRVIRGFSDSLKLIKKLKPDVVFSKGGFVTVPVVLAAKICGIPVVIHESDMTPGLANKISMPFAKYICVTFPETLKQVPKNKGVLTGTPIRESLFKGNKEKGLSICGFNKDKPVVLMMGGSLGSVKINNCLIASLDKLLKSYQVIHICGKGNLNESINLKGYKQFEYVSSQLPHLFAITDVVISRSGANSISEFLALKKPSLLIPISKNASRGDQILNAKSFENQGFAKVIYEEKLTEETLITEIIDLYNNKKTYIDNMSAKNISNGVEEIVKVINSAI